MAEVTTIGIGAKLLNALIELLKPIGLVAIGSLIGGLLGGNKGSAAGGGVGAVGVAVAYRNSWNTSVKTLLSLLKSISIKQALSCAAKFISSNWECVIGILHMIAKALPMLA